MEVLDTDEAARFLLRKAYIEEFIVVDKINQHKDGLSYNDWLRKNKIVVNWHSKK